MSRKRQLSAIHALPFIILGLLMLAPAARPGSRYQTLYSFSGGKDGGQPFGGVILDAAENLYGTTLSGGAYNNGTVFQLTQDSRGNWTEHVLYSFCALTNCEDGSQPWSGLISDPAGNLYGTTYNSSGAGAVFQMTKSSNGAWIESVVHSFKGADGAYPEAGLIRDAKGILYGTTYQGGANGRGVVFELIRNSDGTWKESVLYDFCSLKNCRDGELPSAALVFDTSGNLYGAASTGGDSNCNTYGCGVVFRLTPRGDGSWKESVLHRFTGAPDGAYPSAGLLFDKHGDLYGTTSGGGLGSGAVFKMTHKRNGTWQESIVLAFDGKDGANPDAGLAHGPRGDVYGTTLGGGDENCQRGGCGVVFKLVRNWKGGWNESILHFFSDDPGIFPRSDLIFDKAGNLYGTTAGDNVKSHGSVYRLSP